MLLWLVAGLLLGLWFICKQLFRKALLPLSLARVWGRFHFALWRLFLEVSYAFGHRVRPWKDVVAGRVWLGKSVLSRHVPDLVRLGITRVLNMQDEYGGPVAAYAKHGIEQLWVPIVDHFEPSPAQLHVAVEFLRQALHEGRRVYVHCQGGHGRSAAVVFAHLAIEEEHRPLREVNEDLSSKWRVRHGLHSQPHVRSYLSSKRKVF